MAMARLYHPDLTPPDNECEVPDDEGLLGVLAEAGWLPAPEPEARPGYQPEPVKYAPIGTPVDDLDDKSKEELQDMLRERELPVSGTKDELIARLREPESTES